MKRLADAEVLADSLALVEALCDALVLADSLALVEALIDADVLADSLALVEALMDADVFADSDALVEALMDADVLADSLALVEALIDADVLADFRSHWSMRSLKSKHSGLDIDASEDIPIASFPRRRDYKAVPLQQPPRMLNATVDQNFVPVVDDPNVFIGIVRRTAILQQVAKDYESPRAM